MINEEIFQGYTEIRKHIPLRMRVENIIKENQVLQLNELLSPDLSEQIITRHRITAGVPNTILQYISVDQVKKIQSYVRENLQYRVHKKSRAKKHYMSQSILEKSYITAILMRQYVVKICQLQKMSDVEDFYLESFKILSRYVDEFCGYDGQSLETFYSVYAKCTLDHKSGIPAILKKVDKEFNASVYSRFMNNFENEMVRQIFLYGLLNLSLRENYIVSLRDNVTKHIDRLSYSSGMSDLL